MDILKEIHEENISINEAEQIAEDTVKKFHEDLDKTSIAERLKLDVYEYTAYAHGIDLGLLAQWRYKGWPKKCKMCGKSLDYKNWGWMLSVDDKLEHIECK